MNFLLLLFYADWMLWYNRRFLLKSYKPHNNLNLNLLKTIRYELTGYSWSFIFCVKGKSDRADHHRSQWGKLCSIEESLRYIIDMVFFFSINQNI